jgi:hypothetical protein
MSILFIVVSVSVVEPRRHNETLTLGKGGAQRRALPVSVQILCSEARRRVDCGVFGMLEELSFRFADPESLRVLAEPLFVASVCDG